MYKTNKLICVYEKQKETICGALRIVLRDIKVI